MTDYEKLLEALKTAKGYIQKSTITFLVGCLNTCSSELPKELYVPEYEVEKEFFFSTLEKMGYTTKYIEEYNPYFEQMCYKVELMAK